MEEHKISFSKTDYEKVDSKVIIKANDYKSHTFVFEFEDDFDKAILKFKRADGKVFAVDINDGKYTLAGAEIAIAGTVECEISFYADDSRISTNIFTFEVVSDINTKNMTDNAPEVSVFDGLIKEVTAKEKERGENETERKSAEEARKTTENLRVSSETKRAAKFSQIETKFSEYDKNFNTINEKSSEIVNTVSGKMVAFHDSDDAHFKDIEISDTTNSDVTVNVYGKNLANADDFLNLTPQVFEKQTDGSYKGLTKISTSARITVNLPAGTYTYKAKIKAPKGSNYSVAYWTEDGMSSSTASVIYDGENFEDSVVTFTTQKPIIALGFNYGTAGVIDFKEMQLEVGSSATEYEEYKSQSVNLTLPLTDAQKDKFKALSTYKGNTTVLNDKNIDMSVSYKADTKLYIDNKFNELQSAIISLGGNV